jgi:hypothetical protein
MVHFTPPKKLNDFRALFYDKKMGEEVDGDELGD